MLKSSPWSQRRKRNLPEGKNVGNTPHDRRNGNGTKYSRKATSPKHNKRNRTIEDARQLLGSCVRMPGRMRMSVAVTDAGAIGDWW